MASNTIPPFVATLAHPHLEAASADVYQNDDMEKPTGRMFRYLLEKNCLLDDKRALVVDAGANLGYFSTYAASMGCSVISVEPQPRLLPIINLSKRVNSFQDRMYVYNNIISDNRVDKLKINYDTGMCWGCSVVTPAQPGEKSGLGKYIIDAIRLDDVILGDTLLLKVDVEGFEVMAIESANETLEQFTISNILVEWTPKRWKHSVERGTKLLEKLYDIGYTIRHYDLRNILPPTIVNEPKVYPLIGKTWVIERNNLSSMNDFLLNNGYGEANLWISKDS